MAKLDNDQIHDASRDDVQELSRAHVSERVFESHRDFGQTLGAALDKQKPKDDAVIAQVDGPAGPPEIVGDQNQNRVKSTVEKDGKVVREKMEHGPDMVVSYDEQGKAHRTPDEPIKGFPITFEKIPQWRDQQLNNSANELIKKYTEPRTPTGERDGKLSFNDLSSMMKEIGKMDNLTETEKCAVWSHIRVEMDEQSIPVLDADEKPEMIDSWKGSRDPWHAIMAMSDGYHGDRLINMSPEDASKAILDHENGAEANQMPWYRAAVWKTAHTVFGVNSGDINASEGQLKALRALRSSGTFSAYANEWTEQFVRKDRDQYGRPR